MNSKNLFFLTMIVVTVGGCQSKPEAPKGMPGTAGNPAWEADIKVVRDLFGKLLTGDLEGAKAYYTEDYRTYGPAIGDTLNIEGELASWQRIHELYSDLRVAELGYSMTVTPENENKDIVGNWVMLWGVCSGRAEKYAKDISFPYHVLAKVENGKVAMARVYRDNLGVLSQLGYVVTPPEGEDVPTAAN